MPAYYFFSIPETVIIYTLKTNISFVHIDNSPYIMKNKLRLTKFHDNTTHKFIITYR